MITKLMFIFISLPLIYFGINYYCHILRVIHIYCVINFNAHPFGYIAKRLNKQERIFYSIQKKKKY